MRHRLVTLRDFFSNEVKGSNMSMTSTPASSAAAILNQWTTPATGQVPGSTETKQTASATAVALDGVDLATQGSTPASTAAAVTPAAPAAHSKSFLSSITHNLPSLPSSFPSLFGSAAAPPKTVATLQHFNATKATVIVLSADKDSLTPTRLVLNGSFVFPAFLKDLVTESPKFAEMKGKLDKLVASGVKQDLCVAWPVSYEAVQEVLCLMYRLPVPPRADGYNKIVRAYETRQILDELGIGSGNQLLANLARECSDILQKADMTSVAVALEHYALARKHNNAAERDKAVTWLTRNSVSTLRAVADAPFPELLALLAEPKWRAMSQTTTVEILTAWATRLNANVEDGQDGFYSNFWKTNQQAKQLWATVRWIEVDPVVVESLRHTMLSADEVQKITQVQKDTKFKGGIGETKEFTLRGVKHTYTI